jgi:hypothetical protein
MHFQQTSLEGSHLKREGVAGFVEESMSMLEMIGKDTLKDSPLRLGKVTADGARMR